MLWSSRTKKIHFWWLHLLNYLLPIYCPLLSRNNLILYRWTSLPSWPTMASWLAMSIRNISKTICASVAVQGTISWTLISRSRPQLLPKTTVLQQLFLKNSQKNREQSSELHIDWGLYWTSLCSNKSYLIQCIHSFWSLLPLCLSYFFLNPWLELS